VGKSEREPNDAHDLAPEFAGLTSVSSLVAGIFLSHFVAKRKTEKVDLFEFEPFEEDNGVTRHLRYGTPGCTVGRGDPYVIEVQ
jgi:hypothetical protein